MIVSRHFNGRTPKLLQFITCYDAKYGESYRLLSHISLNGLHRNKHVYLIVLNTFNLLQHFQILINGQKNIILLLQSISSIFKYYIYYLGQKNTLFLSPVKNIELEISSFFRINILFKKKRKENKTAAAPQNKLIFIHLQIEHQNA